jgi:tRNA A37 threonylcarbamoyladenosine synthetase subunit TsaC/SUA5/YrdC
MSLVNVRADAQRAITALKSGQIAILPHDVSYGIWGHSVKSIEEIYRVKGRQLTKTSGNIGSYDLFKEVHVVEPKSQEMVKALIDDFGLPFTVVAPFRREHPFYRSVEPRSIELSTRDGTLALLLNAGPLHNELARLSMEQSFPIFGSSANKSLAGSKFRLTDVEPEVRAIAALQIDYGLSRYHNLQGISSTIIDFVSWKVHRYGACYQQIREILSRWFGVELGPAPAHKIAA